MHGRRGAWLNVSLLCSCKVTYADQATPYRFWYLATCYHTNMHLTRSLFFNSYVCIVLVQLMAGFMVLYLLSIAGLSGTAVVLGRQSNFGAFSTNHAVTPGFYLKYAQLLLAPVPLAGGMQSACEHANVHLYLPQGRMVGLHNK
jgi:hypothetical protein